jgi:hypothetical protein
MSALCPKCDRLKNQLDDTCEYCWNLAVRESVRAMNESYVDQVFEEAYHMLKDEGFFIFQQIRTTLANKNLSSEEKLEKFKTDITILEEQLKTTAEKLWAKDDFQSLIWHQGWISEDGDLWLNVNGEDKHILNKSSLPKVNLANLVQTTDRVKT